MAVCGATVVQICDFQGLIVDNIDSVTGIGNLSRDQYTTVHSMVDRHCWPMFDCLSRALLEPV